MKEQTEGWLIRKKLGQVLRNFFEVLICDEYFPHKFDSVVSLAFWQIDFWHSDPL
jgi:hypothetical protein